MLCISPEPLVTPCCCLKCNLVLEDAVKRRPQALNNPENLHNTLFHSDA
jgi:hypothetical protein